MPDSAECAHLVTVSIYYLYKLDYTKCSLFWPLVSILGWLCRECALFWLLVQHSINTNLTDSAECALLWLLVYLPYTVVYNTCLTLPSVCPSRPAEYILHPHCRLSEVSTKVLENPNSCCKGYRLQAGTSTIHAVSVDVVGCSLFRLHKVHTRLLVLYRYL